MLGIRFIKAQPTVWLMQYRNGEIVREGAGLSFFYFGPTTSLVAVPIASTEAPFIFEESTADYQSVTIQGQVTYRVADARRLASLMNFTLDRRGDRYVSDDPEKLPERVVNVLKVLARAEVIQLKLREAIRAEKIIGESIRTRLKESGEIEALGLEVLGLSILAIKPNPETARALEAQTREQLLKEADEAIYARRNASVEQERSIKENELNTEIAVEAKKRQIRETQMDAERAIQEKKHEMAGAELAAQVQQEHQRQELVGVAAGNARIEADARAYGISAMMKSLGEVDPKVLQALASTGMKPEQLIAVAFQEIAGRADKIGQLNISPELLRELLDKKGK
jgi:hypothetical protein